MRIIPRPHWQPRPADLFLEERPVCFDPILWRSLVLHVANNRRTASSR